MIKRQSYIVITILVTILILAGWFTFSVLKDNWSREHNSDIARSFNSDEVGQYTDLAGEPIAIDELFGEILVVNLWASWSPESQDQLLRLSSLAEQYSTEPVTVLAINRSEPVTTAEAYLRTVTLNENLTIVLDDSDNFYESIEAYAMPVTLVYDINGNVVYEASGNFSVSAIQSVVDEQLSL
jgi:thiol-disulfide isomerase/thioredoxin